jgi:hypothetical protein
MAQIAHVFATLSLGRLRADCVDKRFGTGDRAILIQERRQLRNIDSKNATDGFDCCANAGTQR